MSRNEADEKVVAVIEPSQKEDALAVQITDIEVQAENMLVENDQQYKEAGEFGIILKRKMSEVTEFFAPMKKAAHEAHKNVCDREKQMLAPLKSAEAILKKTMGDYVTKKERERREAEEKARQLAREETERKLAEAERAEIKRVLETGLIVNAAPE